MSLPPSPMWRRWYRFLNSKDETSSLPRRQRIQVEFLIPAKGTNVSSKQWEKSIAIKASCHTPGRKRMAPETHIFVIFTPKIGEDEPILTSIFSTGLVQPPTSIR